AARRELHGKIVELGGWSVLTGEAVFFCVLRAGRVKKPKLKLPGPLLIPAAREMEAVSTNPPITPDEVNMSQADNLAAGIDSVSSQFGWRPTAPGAWAPTHWAKPVR